MMLYYIQYIKRKHNKFNFPLLNSKGRKEGKDMKKNKKIRRIEELFQGGEIEIFELLHFMIMYGEGYKRLEFETNSNEILIFYKKKESMFFDLIDNSGNKVISGYQVELYHNILEIPKVKKKELFSKKFSINKVIEQ